TYSQTAPYWSASQSASLLVRDGWPSKRATSSRVALPTWIFNACFVCGSYATKSVHSPAVSVSCATIETAASPNRLTAINGILALIGYPESCRSPVCCRYHHHVPLLPLGRSA